VVLFSLILATGAGSLLSDYVPLNSAGRFRAWSLLLAGYILLANAFFGRLTGPFIEAGILTRILVTVALIAPAGVLMGFGFPTGMRLVGGGGPSPWFWGINGATGVLGSAVSVVLSISMGISFTAYMGAICYVALIPCAAQLGHGLRERSVLTTA